MKKILLTVITILACANLAVSQRTGAETDYYPVQYRGEAWVGELTAVNDDTHEITLTYKGKDKTETFVGVLEDYCMTAFKDGSSRYVKLSDFPHHARIKVYYITQEDKATGVKVSKIFRMRLMPQNDK